MLKTVEDISATKKRLHVEIPADAIESEIQNALRELRARTRLPGFRQGKAPVALIEKRYGREVEAEAVEKIIPRFYSSAVKEAEITPVANPVLESPWDFKRKSPMSLTFTVEVRPAVENLSYEGVTVEEVPTRVTDEDVETTIERLREERAVYEPTEEPAGSGDLVVVDYEGGGQSREDEVFKLGGDHMPQEFSEHLSGKRKGEDAAFEVAFPEEYVDRELAGSRVPFTVKVKDVKKGTLPPLDDEFAKDLGSEGLEALRAKVRERMEQSQRESVERMYRAEVLKRVLETNPFEAPESLVEAELGFVLKQARAQGRTDSDEVLREELRPAAERQIRASLLLQMIAEREGVEVTEEDMNRRVAELAGRLNLTPENVVKYYVARDGSLEGLQHSLLEDKVLDLLRERAVIEKGG
jgi:trigger factor